MDDPSASPTSSHRSLAASTDLERLITDLTGLLESSDDGREVADAIEPAALHRLTRALERVVGGGDDGPGLARLMAMEPSTAAVGERPPSVERMYRPAVEATLARLLFAGAADVSSDSLADEPSPPIAADQLLATLLHDLDTPVSLQGTTGSLPIGALIGMIGDSRRTGTLHFRTPREHLRFEFVRGAVVGTRTNASPPGQRLGDMAVASSMVSESERDAALEQSQREAKPLGRVFVERGLLSIAQLSELLLSQVRSRFDRVIGEEAVAYAFHTHDYDEGDGRLRLGADELLADR